MLYDIDQLYKPYMRSMLSKHVFCKELVVYAEEMQNFIKECTIINDEYLLEVQSLFRRHFFKLCGSLLPYSDVIDAEAVKVLLFKLNQIKLSYPDLFIKRVTPLAISFRRVLDMKDNYLMDCIIAYLNQLEKKIIHVAIVLKRVVTQTEHYNLKSNVSKSLNIVFFSENSFRKSILTFDEVIFIGTPNYFGSFSVNTPKSKNTQFISYEMFTNKLQYKPTFNELQDKDFINTVYENITFGESFSKTVKIEIEHINEVNNAIQKLLESQSIGESQQHQSIEASIVYLENGRFIFAAMDSKIRLFIPNKKVSVQQISFKELEEDDYIILRNDRDTKLIAEVADKEVLKGDAEKLRMQQDEWKQKLRFIVKKNGLVKVGRILKQKFNMKTATAVSVRGWCGDDSICPTELPMLLKALKYESMEAEGIYLSMKRIQRAHIQAGRIISQRLMSELSTDICRELQEKGQYTFMSKTFNGASFNIERVIGFDHSKHDVIPNNLMKPFKIYD